MLATIGIILIVVGLIVILFGNKEIHVPGGIILRTFNRQSDPLENEDFLPEWSYRVLFGGALIFAGFMVLINARNVP